MWTRRDFFTSSPAIIPGCMWNKDKPRGEGDYKIVVKHREEEGKKKTAGGSCKRTLHAQLSSLPAPSLCCMNRR